MLNARPWVPEGPEEYMQALAKRFAGQTPDQNERDLPPSLKRIASFTSVIASGEPGHNAINPKAEAMLASGVGSRPSLGYPGDKYEMGLEGVEKIEVLAAELVAGCSVPVLRAACCLGRPRQPLRLHDCRQAGRYGVRPQRNHRRPLQPPCERGGWHVRRQLVPDAVRC